MLFLLLLLQAARTVYLNGGGASDPVRHLSSRSFQKRMLPMKLQIQQRGVTSIEYGLLAALIAVVVISALSSAGVENGGLWERWTSLVINAIRLP